MAPVLYRLLEDYRRRNLILAILYFFTVIFVVICCDYLQWNRILVAICRFPVFLVGMAAGFFLLEEHRISKSEYYSLILMCLLCLFIVIEKMKKGIPLYGWKWIPYTLIAPVFCIVVSRMIGHVQSNSRVLIFLTWIGKNSLLIYLFNVVFVRFGKIFAGKIIRSNHFAGNIYSLLLVILNLMVVFFVVELSSHLRKLKK